MMNYHSIYKRQEHEFNTHSNAMLSGALFKEHSATANLPSFVELLYLVTRSDHICRGFGSKVINHLQESLKGDQLIVSFVANKAIQFFLKHGFKVVSRRDYENLKRAHHLSESNLRTSFDFDVNSLRESIE